MRSERIAKALGQYDNAYQDMAEILFGDGAEELISKLSPDQSDLSAGEKKRHKRQAQVGLASNVVGLGAGVGGTAAALRDDRLKDPKAPKWARTLHGKAKKIPAPVSSKTGKAGAYLAGGALGLQVANIGGDVVANRVLSRSAKKDKVKKSEGITPNKGKLVRVGTSKAKPHLVEIKDRVQDSHRKKDVAKSDEAEIVWEGEISKMDTDKRQVFGWASVVEVNGEPVTDLQGDYISTDEIEKAAYSYVQKSRKGGDMHRRNGEEPHHASDMIESMMFTPEKIEKMGLSPGSVPTGWWVGYQVHDDDLWQEVKKGRRTGFSIHGRGVRKEMT